MNESWNQNCQKNNWLKLSQSDLEWKLKLKLPEIIDKKKLKSNDNRVKTNES